jgi:hypothetical protein
LRDMANIRSRIATKAAAIMLTVVPSMSISPPSSRMACHLRMLSVGAHVQTAHVPIEMGMVDVTAGRSYQGEKSGLGRIG